MIRSLDDAWSWYRAVRTLAFDMKRLARKWDDPTLADVLGRDNHLRHRTKADLQDMAETILEELDDLSILVLFSVFESTVRARAVADVDREMTSMRHPAILRAIKDLKDSIQNGSFGKVTAAYQKMDNDLTAQVDQVRKFRNWVAHGRRDEPQNDVKPGDAMDRLGRYLARLVEIEAAGVTPPLPESEPSPTEPPGQDPSPTGPDGPSDV